jgi:hypothetical protein
MQIKIKDNIKQFTKGLNSVQKKQIPFATSMAINSTLFDMKKTNERKIDMIFEGGATSYTKRQFRFQKSTKRKPVGFFFITPEGEQYLKFQIDGGVRTPRKRAVVVPFKKNIRLNKFGNLTKAKAPQALLDKPNVFSANIKGVGGIYQRSKYVKKIKNSRVKLLLAYEDQTNYRNPRYPFYETNTKIADRVFGRNFKRALARALKTAR